MPDIWDMWTEEGASWHSIFGLIDPVVTEFIAEQARRGIRVVLIPYRWDEPSRILEFPSPAGLGISNNIELLVLGRSPDFRLRFSCAAWRDEDSPATRIRRWCHSSEDAQERWMISAVSKRYPAREFQTAVSERLALVFSVVTSWTLNDLGSWFGDSLAPEPATSIPQPTRL
jgi:hypothetical protein